MAKKIFVNLPVKDLDKSIEFFTKLGHTFNPQFTDETATCMIVGGDIFVMLLTHAKFKTFAPNEICDARKSTEVLVCLSCDSRENVDEMVRKAVAAGGNTYNQPQNPGFMYGHGFQDLDGHIWENHLDGPRHNQSRLKRRLDMARYVDGFVLPVPKKNVQAYRRVAQLAGKVWREHGALEYIECVADDVKPGKYTSFPQSVKLKRGETVFFSWIVYKSRKHRDRVISLRHAPNRP